MLPRASLHSTSSLFDVLSYVREPAADAAKLVSNKQKERQPYLKLLHAT
jgi:hypothetical protein